MAQIQVQNLSFSYSSSADPIFENVSFQIDTNWKIGFLGRNGKGKTTFLKLLMGQYAYSGVISSSVPFDYFPYSVRDRTQNTLAVVEELDPEYEHWKLCRELALLDVPEEVLYRPFYTLSNGEQTKILLAVLFLQESHFLLIDEPTNHLDLAGRRLVRDYLNHKKGFLLVSHDRAFLDHCVDHVLSLNKTTIDIQKGNATTWQQNKAYQEQYERAEQERLQKEVAKLSAAAERTARWSDAAEKAKYDTRQSGLRPDRGYVGHKAAKMMKRSQSVEQRRQKALEEKSNLLRDVEQAEPLKLTPLHHPASYLLEAENLRIFYDNMPISQKFSLRVSEGERIALQGRNGAGKSSFLKLLLGESIEYDGRLWMTSGLQISYIPQDTSFLEGDLTGFAQAQGLNDTLFKTILRKLGFSRAQFEKHMETFSEGQKKKVLLSASLCKPAHLYLWDEPLNYIDLLSRVQVEELLLAYRPTLLFVEHDEDFTQRIATGSCLLEPR